MSVISLKAFVSLWKKTPINRGDEFEYIIQMYNMHIIFAFFCQESKRMYNYHTPDTYDTLYNL